jgi:hypothetical protein
MKMILSVKTAVLKNFNIAVTFVTILFAEIVGLLND